MIECEACAQLFEAEKSVIVLAEHARLVHRRKYHDAMFSREPRERVGLAIAAINMGYHIFPLPSRFQPDVPRHFGCVGKWTTNDPSEARAWWAKYPYAAVGLIPKETAA